jgi:hypothetical protein
MAAPFESSTVLIVCPHCMANNDESAYLCHYCLTPLRGHAEMDPMYRIYSEWNTYRKAIAAPTRLITVIGMWLIFGPVVLSMAGTAAAILIEGMQSPYGVFDDYGIPLLLTVAVSGIPIVLYGTILFRVTRNYLRRSIDQEPEVQASEEQPEADAPDGALP